MANGVWLVGCDILLARRHWRLVCQYDEGRCRRSLLSRTAGSRLLELGTISLFTPPVRRWRVKSLFRFRPSEPLKATRPERESVTDRDAT